MIKIPLSILIPCRNEEKNIARCLEPIANWVDEIVVVDSQSTDRTQEIVESYGAKFIQFNYTGGWPKKRQWALDNFSFRNNWILLLDSLRPRNELFMKMKISIRLRPTNLGFYQTQQYVGVTTSNFPPQIVLFDPTQCIINIKQ